MGEHMCTRSVAWAGVSHSHWVRSKMQAPGFCKALRFASRLQMAPAVVDDSALTEVIVNGISELPIVSRPSMEVISDLGSLSTRLGSR